MHRRFRIDVADGDALVVLVNDLSRDFPVDDSLKKSHESCIRNSAALGDESISFGHKIDNFLQKTRTIRAPIFCRAQKLDSAMRVTNFQAFGSCLEGLSQRERRRSKKASS